MRALQQGFLDSAARFPGAPALDIGGAETSYRELCALASSFSCTLDALSAPGRTWTAVLGHRSKEALAGVLAALFRGHAYVPLQPSYPPARTASMLQRSGAREVIVDARGEASLPALLAEVTGSFTFLLPHAADVEALRARWPEQRFFGRPALTLTPGWQPRSVAPGSPCYVLFTSGSTGMPKGVVVTHQNVAAFLDACQARYELSHEDRFSQTFDLTFDLSVFDLFAAWQCGGCVCCPSDAQLLTPRGYLQQARLSVWFSVPSAAALMKRLGALAPGAYPGLRLALFCGEGLPVELAEAFAEAAPNAIVENLYGPTELTLACSAYRFDARRTRAEAELDLVPIGDALPGMRALVVDEQLMPVPRGEVGELLMTGPQLSAGYLDDPQRTALSFVRPPGEQCVFYRTGDRVRSPAETAGPLKFLGRVDAQVKVRGYRIEVGEVEAALRRAAQVDAAIVIPWPVVATSFAGLVGFVTSNPSAASGAADRSRIMRCLREVLPEYMMPSELRVVDAFPLNKNGKIDRGALTRLLERDSGRPPSDKA